MVWHDGPAVTWGGPPAFGPLTAAKLVGEIAGAQRSATAELLS